MSNHKISGLAIGTSNQFCVGIQRFQNLLGQNSAASHGIRWHRASSVVPSSSSVAKSILFINLSPACDQSTIAIMVVAIPKPLSPSHQIRPLNLFCQQLTDSFQTSISRFKNLYEQTFSKCLYFYISESDLNVVANSLRSWWLPAGVRLPTQTQCTTALHPCLPVSLTSVLPTVDPIIAKQAGIHDGNGALDFCHEGSRHALRVKSRDM